MRCSDCGCRYLRVSVLPSLHHLAVEVHQSPVAVFHPHPHLYHQAVAHHLRLHYPASPPSLELRLCPRPSE